MVDANGRPLIPGVTKVKMLGKGEHGQNYYSIPGTFIRVLTDGHYLVGFGDPDTQLKFAYEPKSVYRVHPWSPDGK